VTCSQKTSTLSCSRNIQKDLFEKCDNWFIKIGRELKSSEILHVIMTSNTSSKQNIFLGTKTGCQGMAGQDKITAPKIYIKSIRTIDYYFRVQK
jgi:hypothetical protein